MPDRLQPNEQLNPTEQLLAPNGKTNLVMQPDGNLVLYWTADNHALWASHTNGKAVTRAAMQADGNFVCYDAGGHPFWASGTFGNPGAWVVLQNDGNLVIYSPSNSPLWATNTVVVRSAAVDGFQPSTHGFLFPNSPPWPFPLPLLSLPDLPNVHPDETNFGLCGGMCFAVRDAWQARRPQLPTNQVGQVTQNVENYLFFRLIDSFNAPFGVLNWIAMMQALDHSTWLGGGGASAMTDNYAKDIMATLDGGSLAPIGVCLVYSHWPVDVFKNHAELAYAYELDGPQLTLKVYDPNWPGRDDIFIRTDISQPGHTTAVETNGTDMTPNGGPAQRIRGFMSLSYAFRDPAVMYEQPKGKEKEKEHKDGKEGKEKDAHHVDNLVPEAVWGDQDAVLSDVGVRETFIPPDDRPLERR